MSRHIAYCPGCRHTLTVDDRFCAKCGTSRDESDVWPTVANGSEALSRFSPLPPDTSAATVVPVDLHPHSKGATMSAEVERNGARPDSPPDESVADIHPLVLQLDPQPRWSPATRLAAAAIGSMLSFAGWGIAEYMVVARDQWPWWDAVWVVCAVASIVAVIGWIVYLRRARRRASRRRG
jgi:hypothetical protein